MSTQRSQLHLNPRQLIQQTLTTDNKETLPTGTGKNRLTGNHIMGVDRFGGASSVF